MLSTVLCVCCSTLAQADAADPVIHFRAGHGLFSIPESFFLGGEHPPDGGNAEGALLLMSWPGMKGEQDQKDGLQVLLKPLEKGDTSESYLRRWVRSLTRPLQDLPKYFDGRPLTYVVTDKDNRTAPHGSDIKLISNADKVAGYPTNDVYVTHPAHPDVVISCARLSDGFANPLCIEHFVTNGLAVQATYPIGFVADWNVIHDCLVERIASFYQDGSK